MQESVVTEKNVDLRTNEEILLREGMRYKKGLFFQAMKWVSDEDDANDLVAETYAKAWRHIALYDRTYAMSTWLHRILRNTAIDAKRKLQSVHDKGVSFVRLGDDQDLDEKYERFFATPATDGDISIGDPEKLKLLLKQMPKRHLKWIE